ncbi:MAG: TonB-dependent receptor [Gammaproteobacteria bacterium]|nr:TonB-dependent receptor [Gammaproteobacteria bacterium]
MSCRSLSTIVALIIWLASTAVSAQMATQQDEESELAEITVRASRVANTRPAATYATPATVLRFDPLTELQSRGLPEGQADVTVRGGLFENTGFRAGAVTVMDPQTGHYAAELPIDPGSLSAPEILTGIDNALAGFNSNIATITYSILALQEGGSILIGAGSDDLKFASLRVAGVQSMADGADIGIALSAALSEGDGTVANGDHEFQRYNLQLQRSTGRAQTDLILAYQDKFYGWPGAYTGFATLPETDDTQTTLLLANHRSDSANGWWQIGAYYRGLEDDYDFNRTTQESGVPGSFDHETRVYGIGLDGLMRRGKIAWNYSGQVTSDDLVRSTDLTNSNFTSRDYATLAIVPSLQFDRSEDSTVAFRFGATLDISSRDSNAVSPVLGATLQKSLANGTRTFSIEYAGTSQVPGYTVLGSGPSGLFGGNSALGREKARQVQLSVGHETPDRRSTMTLFFRTDDNLVDWTFASDSPFARQANPVDIDVFGAEAIYSRRWDILDLSIGYTYLDKDADYGSATVDASFYALNFARHRATLAMRYRVNDRVELRLDNEYREQESNSLRNSSERAFLVSASLVWEPQDADGFGVGITADNLGDDDYEQFPGTPAVGRQVSLSARYAW